LSIKEKIGLFYCKFLYDRKSAHQKNVTFYKQILPSNQLCFDIGGNVGSKTKALLQTGAEVVCCEPQNLFFLYLQKKFRNKKNVYLEKIALGAKKDVLELQISSLFPTLSTLAGKNWVEEVINSSDFFLKIKYDQSEKVQVQTLDELIQKYGKPYFCKIDVEGFEYEVLKGLSQKIPLLSFEFFNYNMANTNLCLERLHKLDFTEFNWSIGEKQKFEMQVWNNKADLLKDIQSKNKKKYSGDIYAR